MDTVRVRAHESSDFRLKSTENQPKVLILQDFYGSGPRGRKFESCHSDQKHKGHQKVSLVFLVGTTAIRARTPNPLVGFGKSSNLVTRPLARSDNQSNYYSVLHLTTPTKTKHENLRQPLFLSEIALIFYFLLEKCFSISSRSSVRFCFTRSNSLLGFHK